MNSSEQRKGYIKHFYSKIWPSKRIKYGFCQYDKDLIELVRNTVPSKVLDNYSYYKSILEKGENINNAEKIYELYSQNYAC